MGQTKYAAMNTVGGTKRACHTDGLQVMNRDRRLTGFLRGQTANPVAPDGYELNNPWRV